MALKVRQYFNLFIVPRQGIKAAFIHFWSTWRQLSITATVCILASYKVDMAIVLANG